MIKELLNKITKRQIIVVGIIIGVFSLAGIIAFVVAYNKRETLLATTISRMKIKMHDDYNMDVAIGKAYFSGLTTVTLEEVHVVPHAREQLLGVRSMSIRVKVFPLITGDIRFGSVQVHEAEVRLVKKDSVSNYEALLGSVDTTQNPASIAEPSTDRGMNLAKAANRMLNSVLYKIPEDMELSNFSFSYRDDSTQQRISVPEATIIDGDLDAAVFLNDNKAAWQVSGKLNPGKRQLYIKVHANGKRIALPLLERKLGLDVSFDTIETRLREVYWRNNEFLHIKGEWAVKNLTINHWRIAQTDVGIPNAHMDAELIVGNNHLELSKESAITVKKLRIHPHIRYTSSPSETYAVAISTPEMDAQDLFDAFPDGLFESLEGLRVQGRIRYELDAFLDTANPDSVQFRSDMRQTDFNVNAWGKANIPKLNLPFIYTPYEDERPVRDIVVGPENPDFTPLSEISPNLKNAILTTEDPSFFSHNGFVEEAIRSSIAINYKEKAFKRGASTISMQLVKNAFLNRNKTVVRKLEEILIVWLMESTSVVTKERMLEVYLNIIEWGRNVYGISEAARYYFGKDPSTLDLGESIYLASIVPRPKTGLYSFNYQGRLKPYIGPYFSYIGNIMARRGLAAPDSSSNYGFYAVSLREALRPEQPVTIDSLQLESPPTEFEVELDQVRGLLERISLPSQP